MEGKDKYKEHSSVMRTATSLIYWYANSGKELGIEGTNLTDIILLRIKPSNGILKQFRHIW